MFKQISAIQALADEKQMSQYDQILEFARKHKEAIQLDTKQVRADLEAINEDYEKNAPIVRDQRAFNERYYTI